MLGSGGAPARRPPLTGAKRRCRAPRGTRPCGRRAVRPREMHLVARELSVHQQNRFPRVILTKVCDRISDGCRCVLRGSDRAGWDPRHVRSRETLATTNRIIIAGETRGPSQITRDHIAHLARLAVKDIGYEQPGFHWEKAAIRVYLHAQSSDIAQANSAGNKDEGAGDQGIMFGYASAGRRRNLCRRRFISASYSQGHVEGARLRQTHALGPTPEPSDDPLRSRASRSKPPRSWCRPSTWMRSCPPATSGHR